MDGPLDFEFEEPRAYSPVNKKRNKVIGLDDLLTDYYKEQNKAIERESKRAKAPNNYHSDDDEDDKEALLLRKINECHNQMKEIGVEEDIPSWGLQVFGNQKTPPSLVFPELGSCSLLQSFMNNEVNSLVELTMEKGETFLEGLLVNGWLSKLVPTHCHIETSIAKWTFNLMLYSSKEKLSASACDFWCSILSPKYKTGKLSTTIEWLPSYSELKTALETYGFLFNFSSETGSVNPVASGRGPPKNIRALIKFITACCHVRAEQPFFSASEAEQLAEVIVYLSVDLQLQGLVLLLHESLQSVINYFTDEEWKTSCQNIAISLASRVPKDLNCLQILESISRVNIRSNHFRSVVSYQMLLICFDNKATNEEEILNLLSSINAKDKKCNLFKMYIYLVLSENWLLSNPLLDDKSVIRETWDVYLRRCSCQISSTDLRPYASKVRTKASYILHGTARK